MSLSTSKTLRTTLLPLALGMMFAAGTVAAAEPTGAAAEVIAIAKAQWAAENESKPASQAMSSIADDYTEFNPVVPTLVQGKPMAATFYTASLQSGDKTLVSEMINPHVQVYGDTAILTYNYAGMTKDGDGKMHNDSAKSTRVYVKQGGDWKLVHANFAPVIAEAP